MWSKIVKKKYIILTLVLLTVLIAISVDAFDLPIIERNKCVGCEDCIQSCPVDAITIVSGKAVIDNKTCINCGKCYRACTYNSIRTPHE
ncbi:MAG: 4Fe-4S binding protein [Candidatus Cloacimonetes bacterium]|nr:4Fe-4S binding protein [Candidatus Cloacimonadota bacterium]